MKTNRLRAVFKSFVSLGTADLLRLFDSLEHSDIAPEYYYLVSRRKQAYQLSDRDSIIERCIENGNFVLKSATSQLEIGVASHYARPYTQTLSIRVKQKTNIDQTTLTLASIFELLNACYAYSYVNNTVTGWTPGRDIENCLPHFSWLNFFGKPYIDEWGVRTIANAPAIVRFFKDDAFASITLSEDSYMPFEEIMRKSVELEKYFGLDYFFKDELEFQKTTFRSIQEIQEYDDYTRRSITHSAPDFHKYHDYRSNRERMFLLEKGILNGLKKSNGNAAR